MKYDGSDKKISDYLEQIKKNKNDLLDDNVYDLCKMCENNKRKINEYYYYERNICKDCYEKCKNEKGVLVILKK